MPDSISEEANIDGWLTHFEQKGQYDNIRDWRQRIEDKEARSERRPSRLVEVADAVEAFRHALLTDEQYSESATGLLRELNRTKPPIVELWRLQSIANRPAVLTPEQQTCLDQYDQRQRDRAKWDMPIPENRLLEWDELDARGLREAVWADQAKLFEEWLDQHPERAEELVPRYAKPGPPPNESNLPESYHWSGLYWLAANVVFKRFGLGDDSREEVAKATFERYKYFWKKMNLSVNDLNPARREELDTAGGEAYLEAHKRLSHRGVQKIQHLERWLVRSMHRILDGGRALDPEKRKRERRKKKAQTSVEGNNLASVEEETDSTDAEINQVETFSQSREPLDPERDLRQFPSGSYEDDEDLASKARSDDNPFMAAELAEEAQADDNPFGATELVEFVRCLSDQQKTVFVPLTINPTLTNEDIAQRLGLTPRRIAQILGEVLRLWSAR